ncbi:HAD family hydrolase [Methylocucumis oryzae]|uniref:Haloacid dehalogenase n=1 Tax=Methylocucumis oryzae TaxID=1632867 RepID=A0A0F3IHI3_9GAMM|nr:HAD family phosphatase [Methylocucumis oryzae]KJV06206.1 hypothetical protein VZ94_12830 [Methylocucumis oryzae]
MLKIPKFSAVIFDLDGLVLDTESGYRLAWQEAAAHLGYSLSQEFLHGLTGLTGTAITHELFNLLGADFPSQLFFELSAEIWRHHAETQGISVKSGVYDCLAKLIQLNMPYALATNSRKTNALECLRYANLDDSFPNLICRDDVSSGKPAPDIYYATAHALSVDIAQCLVLEDSYPGVLAAVTAGAYCVYVPSTPKVDVNALQQCHLLLMNLEQALDLIFTPSNLAQ